jgi:hypothetical protein
MDEKVRPYGEGYGPSDYDYPEWHWWHNALGVVIVLAIVYLISL